MLERIQETAEFLRNRIHTNPETAIILGTGLGSLVGEITDKYEISYQDIPHFPISTVEGHSGKLIFGKDAFGWGDVKYMIATAMFFGVLGMMFILAGACIFSLIWFLCDRIRRGRFRRYFPFGPFLALATLLWCLLAIQLNGDIYWLSF